MTQLQIYNEHFMPLIEQLMSLCNEHQIPCSLTFALDHGCKDDEGKEIGQVSGMAGGQQLCPLIAALDSVVSHGWVPVPQHIAAAVMEVVRSYPDQQPLPGEAAPPQLILPN